MFIKFQGDYASDRFISIVILSYKRFDMTQNLVESIHQHADMPFEIILHDDASDGDVPERLYRDLRKKVSSLVLSGGELNMGLSASFERGTSLASSDYVLCMNNDTLMLGPGFKDIVRVLQVPYVGAFGPWHVGEGKVGGGTPLVESNGCRFRLGPNVGNGSMMAFRKEVWQEVGGFPHVFSGASDTAFMRTLLKHGYFNAGHFVKDAESFDNVDYHTGCSRTTIGPNKYDISYPCLFKAPNLGAHSKRSEQSRTDWTHREEKVDAGISNNDWWHHYFADAFIPEENNYDWSKLTFHQKWKDKIEAERIKP